MAEPKITSVDISRLLECNPDLMEGLKRPQLREKLQEVVQGSDLKVDEKTGEVIASEQAQKFKDTAHQAEMVRGLINAADGDNTITLDEAKAFMAKNSEDFRGVTPENFLKDAKYFIEKRWGAICANLKQYSLEFPMQNLVYNLQVYNDGIYKEELEQARMSFSPVKSFINVPTWVGNMASFGAFTDPIQGWDYETNRETTLKPTYLGGDNLSMQDAYDDHLLRAAAINALVELINKDMEKGSNGVSWKVLAKQNELGKDLRSSAEPILQLLENAGEISVTVERRGIGADEANPNLQNHPVKIDGKKAAEMLRNQLDFAGLFDIVMTKDKVTRYDKAIKYAQAERAGGGGLGGGNSIHREWLDNSVTAEVNNHYYAKTLLDTVIREGTPEQQELANVILYAQMMPASEKETGEDAAEKPGGFLLQKFFYYGAEALSTLFTLRTWHPVPYRPMPDEEAMYAPERVIKGGLFFAGAPYIFRGPKAVGGLIAGKTSPTLNTWRAAKFSEQAGGLRKGAWALQRVPLGVIWTGDKAWGLTTARPIRNWWAKKSEGSATAGKVGRTFNWLGSVAARGLATYVFDDYTSPTTSESYGPNLNTTAMARIYTLDPLPPTSKSDPLPADAQKKK